MVTEPVEMRETVAVMQPDLILSLALSARILPATSEGDGSARRGGTGWKSTEHFSTVLRGPWGQQCWADRH